MDANLAGKEFQATRPLPEKNRDGLEKKTEKRLANLGSRKKITKEAHASRGQETKRETSNNTKTEYHKV